MSDLHLHEASHPKRDAQTRFDALVGIDSHKDQLLGELRFLLQPLRFEAWQKKHRATGSQFAAALSSAPLILLSGEPGCGKTALATSVGTPLANAIDAKVVSLETPSDIRGMGRVGEVSLRITEAFTQARGRAREVGGAILIVDEADDLVTTRAQTQAHHEDRAGVNVVVKQIDQIAREKVPLAVIMITNRYDAIDPAVVRRAALHLRFTRPDEEQRRAIFKQLLTGRAPEEDELAALVRQSAPRRGVSFSFSDLAVRLARTAIRRAVIADHPLDARSLLDGLAEIDPSPMFTAETSP